MRITSVEFHPDGSSEVVVLSFRDPRRLNPYNVKGITGLDADEIVSQFYGVSGGAAFYNMMLTKRDVVALIELNPRHALDETPSSLRDVLYGMIASSRKGKIQVQFKDGEVIKASITGSVSKMEASLFSATPEVQITLKCDEPFLKSPEPISLPVVALDPSLFTIEDNVSTAPHGVVFDLSVTTAFPTLIIEDPDDDWHFSVSPLGGFLIGDIIHISSEFNDKAIWLDRSGTITHLADVILYGSMWPLVFPKRVNTFAMNEGVNLDWNSITYYETFWGV